MLSKPLSHLRPLLRLPTHTQPDHFTANPSLLHHLPPNGAHGSHAIVQSGQGRQEPAGKSQSRTGGAGYGKGKGTGGSGYTGYARAFLSVPQTAAVDPSAGLTGDESNSNTNSQAIDEAWSSTAGANAGPSRSPSTPARHLYRSTTNRSDSSASGAQREDISLSRDGMRGVQRRARERELSEKREWTMKEVVDLPADELEMLARNRYAEKYIDALRIAQSIMLMTRQGEDAWTNSAALQNTYPLSTTTRTPASVEWSELQAEAIHALAEKEEAERSGVRARSRRASVGAEMMSVVDEEGLALDPEDVYMAETPRSPRHSRAGLSRSGTMVDVGLLGFSTRPAFARTLSTAAARPADSALLAEGGLAELVDTAPATWKMSPTASVPTLRSAKSTRLLPQPNRILMDLAGADLPASRRLNSTVASQSSGVSGRSWNDDVVLPSMPSRPMNAQQQEDQERESKIYRGLMGSALNGHKAQFFTLVQHYRSPRVLAPFDDRTAPGVPALAERYPLSSTWTVNTYNVIFEGMRTFRNAGESVAPVLEVYNEMLERDVLPNGKTYAHVIEALTLREKDIWEAVSRWEAEKAWLAWREQALDFPVGSSMNQQRAELIEGYIAEGNMASALRLFRAATMFKTSSKWQFRAAVYHFMLSALSEQAKPDLEAVDAVFRHADTRQVAGYRSLYRYGIKAYGKSGTLKQLSKVWGAFEEGEISEAERAASAGVDLATLRVREWVWKDYEPGTAAQDLEEHASAVAGKIRGIRRDVYTSAIEAFVALGDIQKAKEILEKALSTEDMMMVSPDGGLRLDPDIIARYVLALIRNGQSSLAIEEHERLRDQVTNSAFGRFTVASTYALVDELVLKHQWKLALSLLDEVTSRQNAAAAVESMSLITRLRKVYTGMLGAANKASTPEEARQILDPLPEVFQRHKVDVSTQFMGRMSEIAEKHGLYDIVLPHMRTLKVSSVKTTNALTDFISRAMDKLPIGSALDLYSVCLQAGQHTLKDRFDIFFKKFAAEREQLSREHGGAQPDAEALLGFLSVQGYGQLMHSVRLVYTHQVAPALTEGEYDASFEYIMKDLATLSEAGVSLTEDLFEGRSKRSVYVQLARVLVDRFGNERARDMMLGAFGEEIARATVQLAVEAEVDAASAKTSNAAQSTSEASVSDPASPSASATISTFSGQNDDMSSATSFAPSESGQTQSSSHVRSGQRLRTDTQLSKRLDRLILGKDNKGQPTPDGLRQAFQLFSTEWNRGRLAHFYTVRRLIEALGRAGIHSEVGQTYTIAQQMLIPMPDSALKAQNWTGIEDSMIIANCHLGHLEQAGAHRHRIVSAGQVPSSDAYATMIASSKDTTDDALVARELFDESQAMGVVPNLYLYNTIISKLSRARKVETALELFRHMKAAGVQPSSVTYGAVINACCRVGDAQSAENLFAEMVQQPNFKPRVPPFNTMIQLFVQTTPNREKALHYHHLMVSLGVQPSAHTYKLLLEVYSTLAPFDLQAMETVFAELGSDKTVPVQGLHFASLITAYGIYGDNLAKSIKVFESISQRRDGSKLMQDAVVWEAILNVLAHRGDQSQLDEMRSRMMASGVRATAYVYNVLITGYTRLGAIDVARELFESMGDSVTGVAAPNNHPALHTSSGFLKPSTITQELGDVVFREPSTYEAMIRAELSVGDLDRAGEVMVRMEARGYPYAVVMKVRQVLEEGRNASTAPPETTASAPAAGNEATPAL